MPRVKRGLAAHKRHTNLLKETKGYRHGRKKIYRLAHQAWLKAGDNAFKHRRTKKRVNRALWIIRLNAAVRIFDMSYSQFIRGLKIANIDMDRKVLSQLAATEPAEFAELAQKVKSVLAETPKPTAK